MVYISRTWGRLPQTWVWSMLISFHYFNKAECWPFVRNVNQASTPVRVTYFLLAFLPACCRSQKYHMAEMGLRDLQGSPLSASQSQNSHTCTHAHAHTRTHTHNISTAATLQNKVSLNVSGHTSTLANDRKVTKSNESDKPNQSRQVVKIPGVGWPGARDSSVFTPGPF